MREVRRHGGTRFGLLQATTCLGRQAVLLANKFRTLDAATLKRVDGNDVERLGIAAASDLFMVDDKVIKSDPMDYLCVIPWV